MIRTLEIPRTRWPAFLESLNEWALGRLVRLEFAFLELGDQELGDHLPFKAIFLDRPNQQLVLILGGDDGEVTHRLPTPARVVVGEQGPSELEWLAFEIDGDHKAFLYFERLPRLESAHEPAPG